jgi:uncharacterized protein YecT (DUF1311 family)
MMKFNKTLTLICLLFTGVASAQIKKDHAIDREFSKCISKDTSVATICNCAFIAIDKWNKEMDKTYDKLLKALKKEEEKAALKESQTAWKAFRDAEFKSYDYMFNIQGRKWCNIRQDGRVDMVRTRALQLQSYLDALKTQKL